MRELILAMDEGEGAGRGAPETIEPVHGTGGDGPTAWPTPAERDAPSRASSECADFDSAESAGATRPSPRGVLARPFGFLRDRFTRTR